MRKLFVFVMMFCYVLSSSAQNKQPSGAAINTAGAVAVAAGTIAAAAYYEKQMREIVEQSAMEWALMNKEYGNGDKLEMKLIEWEVKALSDISSTSNLLFKYKRNDEPYEVILFVLSKGWWNDNGIEFTKIAPITIDKAFWGDILNTLLEVASTENNSIVFLKGDSLQINSQQTSLEKNKFGEYSQIVKNVEVLTDLSSLKKIRGREILFFDKTKNIDLTLDLVKIKGDEHIIGILDREGLILDYNERRIHLFNKSTQDLIKLNQSSVNEIHRLLYREPLLLDAL